ncbi:PepSY domain-containing protein [Ancylobacter sp. 6x-1]|uniref:PepSY domain-containing protein n=1 Tax=Ancylobacter crimeensis TaxID=2579147 RepID=A0ABT0DE51_9HYPH|nr:PepSY-associated TM helix domain-containing protein [Ancylobacter crimeensis]MCK0198248.1 PepSY domain-containing protein [Ancylobacter crimeensis]
MSRASVPAANNPFRAFITRLHFYVGLFVGPFILVAALSGTLYVLTPQIDAFVFREQLRATPTGENRSLKDQIDAARDWLGTDQIGTKATLFAVRPSIAPGVTTRVLFSDPALGESENLAVFVDPVTLEVKGSLVVYGTGGVLPIQRVIDLFHRNLLLGDLGRNYSELAASWLWVAALGGLFLWAWRRGMPASGTTARMRRVHTTLGLWIAAGVLFLSATGLTWSHYAGDNIDLLRGTLGWTTPSVSLKLDTAAAPAMEGEHADHMAMMPDMTMPALPDPASLIDAVHAAAVQAGLDSPMIEIRPAKSADRAWLVREYDRSTPTQVDTLAIDPRTMSVTSRADFATFGLIPKLIRWGIDIHMGIKFGLANQIVMIAIGSALSVTILYGYAMWWRRRPAPGSPAHTLVQSFLYLGWPVRIAVVGLALAFGLALPLMGLSLLCFVAVDGLRWRYDRRIRAVRRVKQAPAE